MKKYLFEILLLLFSVAVPFALDMHLAVYGMLATFLLLLGFRRINYWLFFVFFTFILITCVLFLPEIIWFGHPPVTMIGAFFETDFSESKEFLQSLPFYAHGISLLTLVFGICILYLGKKKKISREKKQWSLTLFMILVGIGSILYRPLMKREELGFSLKYSRVAPAAFYISIYDSVEEYYKLRSELEKGIEGTPSWKVKLVNPHYQNYVLVIGESVRRDYMSLYDFPIENSVFLKNVKGTIVNGYTATAPNTTTALLRMFLKIKDNHFVYADNLISLAKKAGFETYWFSNQGKVGGFDTPIAKIAMQCDHKVFTKKGDYSSKKIYDTVLIPILQRFLKQKTKHPRLFVVHLMGSHPDFPERLEHPIHYHFYNRNISAYLQTIEQTDALLSKIYHLLEVQQVPFSMIYFSDHGLMTKDRNSYFTTLAHGDTNPTKAAYRVPFVLINSDDYSHQKIKVDKSAFNFLKGYAHWLGIEEPTLGRYDFLSPVNDTLKVFNQFKNVLYHDLSEDAVLKEN